MKAMYSHWFKTPDGGLKTFRISVLVFVAVLVGLGVVREVTRSKESLLVQVSHVFEPEVPVEVVEPVKEAAPVEAVEPVETVEEVEEVEAAAAPQKPEAVEPRQEVEPAEIKPVQEPAGPEPVRQEAVARPAAREPAPAESAAREPEKQAEKQEMPDLKVSLPGTESPAGHAIELASEEYAAMYERWRRSGDALDPDPQGISLRIMDLETVYDLFQMKVVAFRGQTPFMDLADNTRVAPRALDEYSGTCFVVTSPWEKWGDALLRAGFRKNDAVEVRYYTYAFVRNAIFARAARAVEWSAAAHLPADADQSRADVLGRVYGVKRSGGGAFGVFVPVQVDFDSGASVAVDPLACFPDEPDILALNRAGLL